MFAQTTEITLQTFADILILILLPNIKCGFGSNLWVINARKLLHASRNRYIYPDIPSLLLRKLFQK